eukprot:12710381-Ditylum_brightwellii.AAC.1
MELRRQDKKHHNRKHRKLMTQWHLTSHARFYAIKNNEAVMAHLQRLNISINLTNITAKSVSTFGWFFLSHPYFTSRDDARNELMNRLDTNKMFDLHVHPIKFMLENKTLLTKAIAITGDKQSTHKMQGKLFKLTTGKARE